MIKEKADMITKGAFVEVGSMTWDVWIHACSHGLLGCGYGFEGFHGCITMIFLLNNKSDGSCFCRLAFSLSEGFPRHILYQIFMGMLSILLRFNCIFILDLLWVMWKQLYSLLQVFLHEQSLGCN